MPSLEASLVLAIVVGAMALFASGRMRVDLVALCVLGALLVLRLISPTQALSGLASPATGTVAAMFVLSAGLTRTGLVQWLARRIDRLAGRTELRLIVVLSLSIAALSAFIVNTATVAIFIPVAIVLARARNVSSSRVLMPLSFASQFGGVCTLIGTSTNILVSTIAVASGMRAFGLFEFAPLGLVMVAVGTAYMAFVARWILPRREGEVQQVDKYRLADYLAEFRVGAESRFVGLTWRDTEASADPEVTLIGLIRGDEKLWRPTTTKMEEGDTLLLHGHVDRLISVANASGLELRSETVVGDAELRPGDVQLVEALVPPRSRLVGRTLRSSGFRPRYGTVALAVQRRGRVLRRRLAEITLEGGDSLLLQGPAGAVTRLMRSSDLIVTNELTDLFVRRDRAVIAVLILVAVVGVAAAGLAPILVTALIGAVAMVLFGCLSIEEAYQSIDWRVVFLLGGILPLGVALRETGAASWIVDTALAPLATAGPLAVLAGLYIVTAVLTESMSNNAAAVILAPIAFSLAGSMDVDPRPFLVAITFAASTSFATPVGYQTNTMIYAPGGYRFADYLRVGGPLNFVFWGLAVALIPILWPF
jgi:di/tricarboxylate transporter